MYIPSYDEIKKIDESKYKLCLMVAKRARQINDGAAIYVDDDNKNYVTVAMEEIIDGYVISDDKIS